MRKCLQDGVDPNLTTSSGLTPLHYACRIGNLDIVKLIVTSGGNINSIDSLQMTPKDYALNGNHDDVVTWLNEYEKKNKASKKSSPSLFFACLPVSMTSSSSPISNSFLTAKKTTTSTSISTRKPRGVATTATLPSTDSKAKLKNSTQQNQSNLSAETTEIVTIEKENSQQQNFDVLLCNASTDGNINEVKRLVHLGANINAVCSPGDRTPLHCSCLSGNLELTKYLVENGANINSQNLGGLTPLHIACDRNYSEICMYLIRNGAGVEVFNKSGNNSLHMICYHSLTQLFQDIISLPRSVLKSLDIDMKNSEGLSYIHIAIKTNNIELVKILTEYPSQINCRDNLLNETPLHYSCKLSNYSITAYLLQTFSQIIYINSRNDNGFTPFLLACTINDNYKIIKLLLKHNINIKIKCENGFDALYYAVQRGDLLLLKLLIKNGLDYNELYDNNVHLIQYIDKEKYPEIVEYLLALKLAETVGKPVEDVLNEI